MPADSSPRPPRRRRLPRHQHRARHAPRRHHLRRRRAGLPLAQGHRPPGRRRHPHPRRLQLRRLPALRRHRPLQPDHGVHRRLRRRGRPGDGHLQRLPDPHRGRPPARSAAAQHRPQVRLPLRQPARRERRHAVHRAPAHPASCCASSSSTTRATTRVDAETLAAHEGQRPDRAALRRRRRRAPAAAANPNGSLDNIAGVCNEARNVFGMMPHPENSVEARWPAEPTGAASSSR